MLPNKRCQHKDGPGAGRAIVVTHWQVVAAQPGLAAVCPHNRLALRVIPRLYGLILEFCFALAVDRQALRVADRHSGA